MSRPEIVTKDQLTAPATEQSGGMQRGQAFAHEGVWCGYADFPGHTNTGWHHHGDYATYAYSVMTWLNAGVPPTQVAAGAGHSVAVLLQIYAQCSSASRTPPGAGSKPPSPARAELWHACGIDDRRGPVSAGQHRTRQDQPKAVFRLRTAASAGPRGVPPVGFEPTL